MSSHRHEILLDPPTLVRALKARAAATQHARCATGPTSTTDADTTATRTALDAAEKCVALLRAQLVDDDDAGAADDMGPPSTKRRAVERNGGHAPAAVSSAIVTTSAAIAKLSADTSHAGAGTTTLSYTKTTHTQQPDGTWVTIVVPCAPRETIITLPPLSATLLHFVMESDLQELVLGFLALRDLVAVRIASMVVHEAMMDTALDLWDMSEFLTSVEQARALTSARLTKLHRFKLVPARCLCSAADALAHLDLGATISGAMPSQELLDLGLGRSWRLTGLMMDGVRADDFRKLLGDSISATAITKLYCEIRHELLELSTVSHFALLYPGP